MKESIKGLFTVLALTSLLFSCILTFGCSLTVNYYTPGSSVAGGTSVVSSSSSASSPTSSSAADSTNPSHSQDSSSGAVTANPSEAARSAEFIKVKGTSLYTADNQKFTIRSMGLGNDAYNNECVSINRNHHNEESYRELSEMGFNTVRFYLTCKWFEDDSNPGVYTEEAFNWIDQNIEWARRYNMHIILDMHVPQGGYQSQGEGLALFTDSQNQTRLANLWKEIASRYCSCDTILGYDIVNEPQVPFYLDTITSVDAWTALARKCVSSIRSVDTNHVVFVERITGVRGGRNDWYEPDPVYAYPEVDDDNIVYQGHYYNPYEFTHQRAYWDTKVSNLTTNYTSTQMEAAGEPQWSMEKTTRFDSVSSSLPHSWTKFRYQLTSWDSSLVNMFRPAIKTGELGWIGSLYIDDVLCYKHYADGRVQMLSNYSFNNKSEVDAWYYGSEDNSTGEMLYSSSEGYSSKGCLEVTGTRSASWVTQPELFPLEDGCWYELVFWAKFSLQYASYGAFGFDLYNQPVRKLDPKVTIENDIKKWAQYPASVNKPLFIGEFGCIHFCFDDVSGTDQYIKDAVSIFSKYTCGYNYHDYHEENFGLHLGPSSELPSTTNLNKKLYDILKTVNSF